MVEKLCIENALWQDTLDQGASVRRQNAEVLASHIKLFVPGAAVNKVAFALAIVPSDDAHLPIEGRVPCKPAYGHAGTRAQPLRNAQRAVDPLAESQEREVPQPRQRGPPRHPCSTTQP